MKTLTILLASLLAATFALAETAQPLRALPEVSVRGDSVTLADVIPGGPAAFAKVLLGASPRPGGTAKFGAAFVRAKAAAQVDASGLEIPEVVVVSRPGRELTREEVEAAVVSAVEKRYGEEYELKIEQVSLPPMLNDGELALDVKLPRGNLPTKTSITVDALVDGKVEGRALARVEARHSSTPRVVVLINSIRRGAVVRPNDVELAYAPTKAGSLTDLDLAVGRAAARTLGPGTVLTADLLASPLLVTKGQTVRLVARVGRVVATSTGKALGSAALGEVVSVENSSSGQVVQGLVKEAGLVETVSHAREVN